ncbi:flagellar biosynthesis protein FlgN [Campylobacter iguaniorum]|uniref:flagellar export chaperone FlgN n=1 Tax=Campylobacter iguaniorum TaxID=1244531 RepID=UPI0007C8D9C6|nr:flagellar export chaperone FlgN [Campylobacter iguaniorum]ANE35540.1 flagellar biosynthesis protein FlgN [Campylobacter iguaniorum]
MINKYLDESISLLNELISITKTDIQNIQEANHSQLDEHTKLKTQIIQKFEEKKHCLDNELVKLAAKSNGTDLASILSDEVKDKLSKLRDTLLELQKTNREYAKSVIVVKEFYDSLIKKMFNADSTNSYEQNAINAEQLFKVRV